LLAVADRIDAADCLIVVAGMEGALPSVVGGLTGVPLVAVPTSVGYGTSYGGLAACSRCSTHVRRGGRDKYRQRLRCRCFAARVARRAQTPDAPADHTAGAA
jgi:hypothetical protein